MIFNCPTNALSNKFLIKIECTLALDSINTGYFNDSHLVESVKYGDTNTYEVLKADITHM